VPVRPQAATPNRSAAVRESRGCLPSGNPVALLSGYGFRGAKTIKLTTITLEPEQRKILTFQFLIVAANCAAVGRAASGARDVDRCAAQVREAYDLALSLSIRVSFTTEDCGVFDLGSSYIQESLVVMRDRARSIRAHAPDVGPKALQLRDWEPMWIGSGEPLARPESRAIDSHIRRIEDAMHSPGSSRQSKAIAAHA
jgi:hypothetical protein